MPTLPTQSFNTIVSNTVAGIQGRSSKLINFSIGSSMRAIVEGFAGIYLWFQALVLQLLLATRLSTSTGNDVDTWTVDYMPALPGSITAALPNGSPRLGAQYATGLVTFSRLTAAPTTVFIPAAATFASTLVNNAYVFTGTNAGAQPAAIVQTIDATQSFVVTTNTSFVNYSASLGGYVIPAGVASLTVPVQALTPGTGGNVAIGAITVITSAVAGIDNVVNGSAFTNGVNQETDAQLKARFVLYIQSLQKATEGAIGFVIASIQVSMQWQIFENQDPGGATDFGAVTVYVDDGSGAIPAGTLTSAQTAVNSIRAAGVRAQILAATTLFANPTMTITTAPGYVHNTIISQVVAAITAYINAYSLPNGPGLGPPLSYIGVGAAALAVPGVTDVTNFTINGVAADLVPAAGQTIKAGSVIVS